MFMHCFFLPFCSGKRGVCAFGLPNPPFPLLYVRRESGGCSCQGRGWRARGGEGGRGQLCNGPLML